MIARVRGVTRRATSCGSSPSVIGSMSANTGRAPALITALAVETNVKLGRITSSPGPSPATATAISSAAVRVDTSTARAGRIANQALELPAFGAVTGDVAAGEHVQHGLLLAAVEPRLV
jgi:hypothetical protein